MSVTPPPLGSHRSARALVRRARERFHDSALAGGLASIAAMTLASLALAATAAVIAAVLVLFY